MELEVKLDSTKLQEAINKFPQKMFVRMRQAFRQIGHEFIAIIKRERLSGRPGLQHISGNLARSFMPIVTGDNIDDLALLIKAGGNIAPYARIHEYGGTIVPKKAKMLAIPLAAAKTSAGRPKYTSPRDVPGLTLIKRPGRAPLLVQQHISGRGKSRTVGGIPMFVLVRSVKIPPRLGLYDMWRKEQPRIVNIINTAIGETLQFTG